MNDDNKSIKCNVNSCEYNDEYENYCTLNEIKVSSLTKNNISKKETICDSFKEKNS